MPDAPATILVGYDGPSPERPVSTVAHREPLGVAHREPVWRRDRTPDMKVLSWPPGQLAPRARRAVSCFLVCSARKLWPVISTKCAPWVRRSSAAEASSGSPKRSAHSARSRLLVILWNHESSSLWLAKRGDGQEGRLGVPDLARRRPGRCRHVREVVEELLDRRG